MSSAAAAISRTEYYGQMGRYGTFAVMQSLRSGVPPAAHPIPNRKALRATSVAWEGLRRLLPEPTPSPQLYIDRKGATPFGLSHSNRPSHLGLSQPDISTWLTTGH